MQPFVSLHARAPEAIYTTKVCKLVTVIIVILACEYLPASLVPISNIARALARICVWRGSGFGLGSGFCSGETFITPINHE